MTSDNESFVESSLAYRFIIFDISIVYSFYNLAIPINLLNISDDIIAM